MQPSFVGAEVECPICHMERVVLKANRNNRPYIFCRTFGSGFNYQTARAREFILQLVQGKKPVPSLDSSETEEDDKWDMFRDKTRDAQTEESDEISSLSRKSKVNYDPGTHIDLD